MEHISVEQRRRALVRRHRLAGDADSPGAVVDALVALHATDPATVYLSVLARSSVSTLAEVAAALYDARSLVRWMAMRRTLFVVARDDVALFQAAVSTAVAGMLRRRLLSQMNRNGTVPPVDGDLAAWLQVVEHDVADAVVGRGDATGAQLAADVPALTTTIRARTPSERPQRVTTSVLTLMGAGGRLVRGAPTGPWTSRHHRWEPVTAWWPHGLPVLDEATAQRELARRWLQRFGAATVDDLQWWTGWTKTATSRALASLPILDVDLHGHPGITLTGPDSDGATSDIAIDQAPVAALLPALDPTPMGWKHRDWFLAIDPATIFDRAGNIGPTLWWDGQVIGSWAVAPTGDIRTTITADPGREARAAVEHAASRLHHQLAGATFTPAVRTPLESSLVRRSNESPR